MKVIMNIIQLRIKKSRIRTLKGYLRPDHTGTLTKTSCRLYSYSVRVWNHMQTRHNRVCNAKATHNSFSKMHIKTCLTAFPNTLSIEHMT